jgi:hypothetical protein
MSRNQKTLDNATIVYNSNLDGYEEQYNDRHMRVVMHLFDGDHYVASLIGKQIKKIYSKKLRREVFDGNMFIIMSSEKEILTLEDFKSFKTIAIDRESSQTVLRLAYKKEFNLSLHRIEMFHKRRGVKLNVIGDYPSNALHRPVETL